MSDLKPFIGNKEMFPILGYWDFFQHAGVSPLPSASAQAIIHYAHTSQKQAYIDSGWYTAIGAARAAAASLLNCDKQEIAFVKSTSEGLSIVANAVDWKAGDRIVTTGVEYPANIYPWMNVARLHGVHLEMVAEETDSNDRRVVPLQKLLDAAGQPGTKLVALSHVEFGSGQRHDLAAIGSFCRERGILFVVDAIQSMGAVPIDLAKMNVDYLSAGGQKWLLSPEGTGIFYCRKELLSVTRPLSVGCLNVVNALDFDHYDFTLRPDSGRFESGGYNTAGLMGLQASLEMLNGIGMQTISQRIKDLGDRLITGVQGKGYSVACPRDKGQWSGIISFASQHHPHNDIAAKLHKEKVEIVVRQGRLRVSPHFYNTEAQIDRLIDLLPGH